MNPRKTLGILAVAAALGIAYLGWTFFKPPEQASGPMPSEPVSLQAPDLQPEVGTAAKPGDPVAGGDGSAVAGGDASADEAGAAEAEADTAAGSDAGAEAVASGELADPPAGGGPMVFEILPGESVARFEIDEVLRSVPTHVLGRSDQVSGQIALDPADAAAATVGEILINVRTLATDSEFRDRSIKNKILFTDQHEFVRFTPTAISGLPASLAIGESASFEMMGDLEIVGTVRPASFQGSVTWAAPDRIEGSASTTLRYADFGISIPAARSVNAVEDTLILGLDFVAETQ